MMDPWASGELRYRELVLDPAAFSATVCGRPLSLTKREFEILEIMLSEKPGRIFSRRELSDIGWCGGPRGRKDAVYVHICHIRGKIREVTQEEYIETIWGCGFRLAPL